MRILDMFSNALHYFLIKEKKPTNSISDKEILDDAHKKLIEARNTFSIIDAEFIDYAIYNLKAAEERYNQLIKQAKKK